MPRIHVANIVYDLRALNAFNAMVRRGRMPSANNPIDIALKDGATMIANYLKQRHISFAAGGGDWAPLKDSTKRKKAKRTPGTENLILRESDAILEAIRVKRINRFWTAGIFERSRHPYSKVSVVRMTQIHQRNRYPGHPPRARQIIVVPPPRVQRMIRQRVQRGLSTAVSEANRENARLRARAR